MSTVLKRQFLSSFSSTTSCSSLMLRFSDLDSCVLPSLSFLHQLLTCFWGGFLFLPPASMRHYETFTNIHVFSRVRTQNLNRLLSFRKRTKNMARRAPSLTGTQRPRQEPPLEGGIRLQKFAFSASPPPLNVMCSSICILFYHSTLRHTHARAHAHPISLSCISLSVCPEG